MKLTPALVLGCAAALTAANVFGAENSDAPVYTNKTRFKIPFRYDANEIKSLGAREIQLYVSNDQGTQWRLASHVSPDQGKFDFDATQDAEYWFAVRTLDGQSQLHPSGEFQAGLKVTVDTTAPSLELSLKQSGPGQIELTWNIVDQNPDTASLKLEYQAGGGQWQRVNATSQANGQVSLSVPNNGFVAVRGSVRDLAANSFTAESQLRMSADGQNPQPTGPDLQGPIANKSPNASTITLSRPATQKNNQPANDPFAFVNDRWNHNGQPQGRDNIDDAFEAQNNGGGFVADDGNTRPDVVRRRYPQQDDEPLISKPDERTRIVNTLKVQIGYAVDDVGPSGVSSVDLFITTDNGKKWYRYGSDLDRVSPFRVELPRDGAYGFSIRVRSGVGLAAAPPQPNEKPSMIVIVDTTPPVVQVFPPQQSRGQKSNQIEVRWKVSDPNPAAKSVALYYSAGPNGPWEAISNWHEDTGRYAWTLGTNMPPRFYVRVAARDAAGNTAEADSDQPVIVDMTRPSARMTDIEAIEHR